ncbi:MAG TPA: hypothetical protein VFZ65_21265 [Planctomycetota bacterium]|nr:hypothetical protein [Planctomycetota bacterium]
MPVPAVPRISVPRRRGCETSEPATGHDSPTSILCLQRLSRVSFFPRPIAQQRWTGAANGVQIDRLMGLNDHRQELKEAEHRVESIKVSL